MSSGQERIVMEKNGFEMVFQHKSILLLNDDLFVVKPEGISNDVSYNDGG